MKNLQKLFLIATFFGSFICFLGVNTPSAQAAIIEELQAQIQALLQQIQQLQTQIAQLRGQPAQWCYDFKVNLKYGMAGTEVRALQTALQKEGFYERTITGTFDEYTASAVVGFQEKNTPEILTPWGLKYGTGYVGSTTRAKLNKLYGCSVIPLSTPTPTPTPIVTPTADYSNSWVFVFTNQGTSLSQNGIDYICNNVKSSVNSWLINQASIYNTVIPYDKIVCLQNQVFVPNDVVTDQQFKDYLEKNNSLLTNAKYVTVFNYIASSIDLTENHNAGRYSFIIIRDPFFGPYLDGNVVPTTVTHEFMHGLGATDKYPYGQATPCCTSDPSTGLPYDGHDIMCHRLVSDTGGCYVPVFSELKITNPTAKEIGWKFSLTPPFITVLSPNGGEKWIIGNTYDITWRATGMTDNLEIYLRDDRAGPAYKLIATGLPAALTKYSWKIPSDFWGSYFPGNAYKIQVRQLGGKAGGGPGEGIYDESDNYFSIVAAAPTLPDLIITDFSSSISSLTVNQKTRLTFTIKNIGNTSAYPVKYSYTNKADGSSYYIKEEDTCVPKSSLASWPSLNPGEFCQVVYDFTFPTVGSKVMGVTVDSQNEITESNENNNKASLTITVSPTLPDLVISKLSASPTSAAVNEKIRMTFTIKNIGNASANVDWSYTNQADGVFSRPLSSTCSGSALVQDRCDTCSGAVLKPDYYCQVERDFTFPTTGSKLMQVSVDPTNKVVELDETNNSASLYLNITKKGTITVMSPNGGEQWTTEGSSAFQGDRVYKISWTTAGDVYGTVDILLGGYDQSGKQIDDWKLIKAGASTGQGYHYWTPARDPLYLPSCFSVTPNKYKVKIREATNRPDAITDISDDYFSITTGGVGLENIQTQLASVVEAVSKLVEEIKKIRQ